jgi:hypothetical protein
MKQLKIMVEFCCSSFSTLINKIDYVTIIGIETTGLKKYFKGLIIEII